MISLTFSLSAFNLTLFEKLNSFAFGSTQSNPLLTCSDFGVG